MEPTVIIGLIIFNIVFFPAWIKFYFGSFGEFFSSFCSLIKPDWLSFLTGSFNKDYHSNVQSGAFWGISLIVIMLQAWVVSGL